MAEVVSEAPACAMPDGLPHGKDALRAEMKRRRAVLVPAARAAASREIAEAVCALDAWRRAELVLTYLACGTEADTRPLIERAWEAGKTVALPRCTGPRTLRWYVVENLSGLVRGPHGVWEPAPSAARAIAPPARSLAGGARAAGQPPAGPIRGASACALVPGLAFDAQGLRLGYGGGYYDAFLEAFAGTSLGVGFACQRVPSLKALGACEAHDRRVSLVVLR